MTRGRTLVCVSVLVLLAILAVARPAEPQGAVEITVEPATVVGEAKPLSIGGMNLNNSMMVIDLVDKWRPLQIPTITFPAGNVGDERDLTPHALDFFIMQRKLLGNPLTFVQARLLGGTPENAAAAAAYLKEKGCEVAVWTIGNEPDLYAPHRIDTTWTPEKYCRVFREFWKAMKQADPRVRVAGPATSRPDDEWMRTFIAECGDIVDVLAWHWYPTDGRCNDADALATSALVDADIERYRAWLKDPGTNPKGHDRDISLAITEYAIHSNTLNWRHLTDMVGALWTADVLGRFASKGLDYSHYFCLQHYGGHAVIDDCYDERPVYYTFLLYAQHFGRELLRACSSDPGVRVYATRKGEGTISAFIINMNEGPAPLRAKLRLADASFAGDVSLWLHDAEHNAERLAPLATIAPGPPGPGATEVEIALPPRSTTVVEFGALLAPPEPTGPTGPTEPLPGESAAGPMDGGGAREVDATSTDTERPWVIPGAAWSRGVGEPFGGVGHDKVSYPMIDDPYWQGAPIGGFGAGTIGRTYRGDFARWHTEIGVHRYEPVPANQFSVYFKRDSDKTGTSQVLSAFRPDRGRLSSWKWGYPAGAGRYYALYPKAWFDYDNPDYPVRLVCKQFSPIIPGNYRETSYPVGVFEWQVINRGGDPVDVSVMFTWENLAGWLSGKWRAGDDNCNRPAVGATPRGRTVGVILGQGDKETASEEWDGEFCIAALETPGTRASYLTRFDASSAGDGAEVWNDFADDGVLGDVDDRRPAGEGAVGAALAMSLRLAPGEARSFPFVLAWDFPLMRFGAGTGWYKRYTQFFGDSGRNSWAMATGALGCYKEWERQIDAWQAPVLEDQTRPDWYKSALFNELYYLADGGTAWTAGPEPASSDRWSRREYAVGECRFGFLECFDYAYYNTLDVWFYGSFPLAMLWPEIEKSVMRDFAWTVPKEDRATVVIQSNWRRAARKTAGAVPHDLGSPGEDPWLRPNAYNWQDPNVWKDLNPKYVLLVWRDFVLDGQKDQEFVRDCWPSVKRAMEYVSRMDEDGDGIPENSGTPDQTYDTWSMKGASAYCGGIWLAALAAAARMGELAGDGAAVARYRAQLDKARKSFENELWNGRYYNYDSSKGRHSDSIMADQLAGRWYARLTGLDGPGLSDAAGRIFDESRVRSALATVFARNVEGFMKGEMGAVNGMRPDGTVDRSSEQSQEVWTGTTYGLASLLALEGMVEEAFKTAWGVYNTAYLKKGYWFRTPEAWDESGNFRASMYMRPLAIWALEYVLSR